MFLLFSCSFVPSPYDGLVPFKCLFNKKSGPTKRPSPIEKLWLDCLLALDDDSATVEALESCVVAVEVALYGNSLNLVGAYAAADELLNNVAGALVAKTVVDSVGTGEGVGIALDVVLLGGVGLENVSNSVDDVLVLAGEAANADGEVNGSECFGFSFYNFGLAVEAVLELTLEVGYALALLHI